jgi:hypothetical protein
VWVAGLCVALLVALVVAVLVRRDDGVPDPHPSPRPVARLDLAATVLSDLETAVSRRDTAAAEKLADPGDDDSRRLLAGIVANAGALHVADFSLRVVDEDVAATATLPPGQWAAAVDTGWRFAGFDAEPGQSEVTFTFAEVDDHAALVDVGGANRRTPLWLTAPLRAHRDANTLVMADGSAGVLARYTVLARRAVPVVRRVLPGWRSGLVVEVPSSPDALDETLGAGSGEYAAIAAVTTTVDGSLAPTAPVHVFVNPDVFGALKAQGAQVVMSHEATHVATDAVRSRTPLWLLEGFADYVALRDVHLPLGVTAGQIIRQVRKDGAPRQLPAGPEFDTQTTHLGSAYEAAWLACRLLAESGGEPNLVALYRRASRGEAVDTALRDLFGFGVKEFTRRWRSELETLAR